MGYLLPTIAYWQVATLCKTDRNIKIIDSIIHYNNSEDPTGKNTLFHQKLRRNLVIVSKIAVHLWHKSAIYISPLYVLRHGLVCSIAPRKSFGALTTDPKFQRNSSTETSSFFPVGSEHKYECIGEKVKASG